MHALKRLREPPVGAGSVEHASGRAERGRLVVVGGGMTAQHFVEHLVLSGAAAGLETLLLSEELQPPYDRVHLGDVLSGQDPHRLALRGRDWYEAHGIRLVLKQRVLEIDREARVVRTSTGGELAFDHLVLATGGRPVWPPIPGIEGPGIVAYRTLEDAQRIADAAVPGCRAVVLGGGLLGLEAGHALAERGCTVDVVEAAARLLPRQLDVEGARVLATRIREMGLRLHVLSRVSRILHGEGGLRLCLDSGDVLEADLVVVAAGIRPQDELGRAASLDCAPGGGIVVDDALATSDPGVHAIGECVSHRECSYGFVAPCYAMAETLAARFAGEARRFEGAVPSARLKVDAVDVVAVGDSLAEGAGVSALEWLSQDRYRRIVLREGRMVGAISVGDDPEFPRVQEAVATSAPLRAWQRRRFSREGRLWAAGAPRPVAQWPDAAVLCTCTGTTCATLRAARAAGCRSSLALSSRTGAGTVCGSCRPLIAELAGETADARRGGAGRRLGAVAAAVLVLLALVWAWGPVPPARSIEEGLGVDVLWRDAWWKQVSGFTLLGLCAASLLFSLRKRWPRFRRGSFSGWRVAHTLLGLATIGALGFHTGFRAGENLNFALMVCFSSVVAVGAMAAGERCRPAAATTP